jgi:G:T/U-mismatch repair DNA glycosylase
MASINNSPVVVSAEPHPDWYYDIPVMKTLILGSYPPHEDKRDYDFYYPNTLNRFWKILSEISGCPLNDYPRFAKEAVEERHAIMKKLCAGVQNMGLEITRKGTSARDTDIEIKIFQDILSIIHQHKELTRILLPGFSAPNSTLRSFVKYLLQNNIAVPDFGKPQAGKTIFQITVNDRVLECHVLNSTSTAARIKFDNVLNQFRYSLL